MCGELLGARRDLQCCYGIVIDLFGQHWVRPDTGEMVRLFLLLWVLHTAGEMEKQCLPVQCWRHWESVGDSRIMPVSSILGFQVHAWWPGLSLMDELS